MRTAQAEFRRWERRKALERRVERIGMSVFTVLVGLVFVAGWLTSCPALAEPGQASSRGDRCYGKSCSVRDLLATKTTASTCAVRIQPNTLVCLNSSSASMSYTSGTGTFDLQSSLGTYRFFAGGTVTGILQAGAARLADGTAAAPAFTFASDTNTGLYSVGADQLGVATAGARSFAFSATAGVLEGSSSTSTLTLNGSAGVVASGTSSVTVAAAGRVTLTATVSGVAIPGQQPTSFSAAGAPALQTDANTGRAYWTETATVANTSPYDFGGKAHPVLQRRTYLVDVGTESSAAPTWNPGPRTGGTTATLTVSETSAGATTAGTSPYVFDFRTSTTSTVAGNIASVTGASAGIKLNRGPRWCQRVMPGATITAFRGWYGMASALPTASDTMTGEGVLFRYSTVAADSKWQFCTRDGTTQTCTDTGVVVAASTPALLCADCREGSSCTAWVNGVAITRKTTNLPSAATNLNPLWTVETTAGGTARTVGVSSASIEFN